MESPAGNHQQHNRAKSNGMKRSQSSNSNSEAQYFVDAPVHFSSPPDVGEPAESPSGRYHSAERSPKDLSKAMVPRDHAQNQLTPMMEKLRPPEKAFSPSAKIREEPPRRGAEGRFNDDSEGERSRDVERILMSPKRKDSMKTASLGLRISEMILCLISFSVMAADKTQGWSGDSYDRYLEYRYCLTLNIIAFVYATFQAYDITYHLVSGKHVIRHHLRRHFEFFVDQILAYLLISASSSAATRVVDWQSNWGKDEFTMMATASVALSFLAFAAFAFSSLVSGYSLCSSNST